MKLICPRCLDEFIKRDADVRRQEKLGRSRLDFCCSRSCALSFSRTGICYDRVSKKGWDVSRVVNEDFSSYFIGFCCADGTKSIRRGKTHSVVLYSTDREVLDSIKGYLAYSGEVVLSKEAEGRNKACWSLSFYSDKARFWDQFGLKSVKVDQELPEVKNLYAFLRGLIDGDGSYRFWKGVVAGVEILAYPKLITQVEEFLKTEGFSPKKDGVIPLERLRLGKQETLVLIQRMYSPGFSVCLERKKRSIGLESLIPSRCTK